MGEGDYWSDVGIIEAGELMAGFNDSEWQRLPNVCQSKSVVWQTRCAETLEGETHPAALELLMSAMGSDSREVVMAAADNLLSLAQAGTTVEVTPQLSALVSEARLSNGGRYGFVLDLLLKNSRQAGQDGK